MQGQNQKGKGPIKYPDINLKRNLYQNTASGIPTVVYIGSSKKGVLGIYRYFKTMLNLRYTTLRVISVCDMV